LRGGGGDGGGGVGGIALGIKGAQSARKLPRLTSSSLIRVQIIVCVIRLSLVQDFTRLL